MATAAKFTSAEREKFFAELEVPFDPSKIKWRVMRTSNDGRSGVILPFADPRAYIDRLNQLFTPSGWTRAYPSINRIREELPEGSCTEWKTLSLATHAARQALRV